MSPERWRQVEEIFNQALERPEGERESWVDGACGGDRELRAEIISLLESDRAAAGKFVGGQVEQAVMELRGAQPAAEGRRVGPYRLIRELGRGGMGAVYLAARDDRQYESEVAIKVVRPGLDTDFIFRRFRRERQILARLQHPNIAKLFDGGTAEDETPYLVMEYIDGTWITRYAESNRLSVEERLRLFLPVCAAVAHAHRNFIVHRDLKPGNILIDRSGAPKLLDFGVSKLLLADPEDTAETQGVGMMTPDYASPEQILGEPVTVASDVYSLGAVLYELLTGARPHRIERCTPLALERAICLDETEPPSQAAAREDRALARRLKGDLDNIILRAMEKERERRYASVELLAEDIRRHLDHRPVAARPSSAAYRWLKFVRRNRLAVALGALVAASLAGGALVAMRQARIAGERFQQVRKLASIFVFDVEKAARDLPGSIRLRQLITRTGLEYLGNLSRSSANDWDLKRELATAYMRIGDVQGGNQTSNLGDPAAALRSYKSAQALLDEVLGHNPADRQAALDRMTLLHQMSELERQTGNVAGSMRSSEEGRRAAEDLLNKQPGDPEVAQYSSVFHLNLARLKQQSGDLAGAALEVEGGIRRLQVVTAARPDDRETRGNIAASLARLGAVQAELGRREEAIETYRKGVAELEAMVRHDPNDTHPQHELMLAYSHVGDSLGNPVYDNLGDATGALEAYRKMEAVARRLHETEPEDKRATSDYGIALLRVGIATPQGKEKRQTLERAHELLARVAAGEPRDRPNQMHKAWSEVELGDAALAAGDRASAVRYFQMAVTTAQAARKLDPGDSGSQRWLIAGARKLAEEHARAGDRASALAALEPALALARRPDAEAPAVSIARRSAPARGSQAAGSVYALLAQRETGALGEEDRRAAREWYRQSVELWRKLEMLPGFVTTYRKEMTAAVEALEALNRPGQAVPR